MPGYCVAGTVGHKVISGAKKIEFENRQIVIISFVFFLLIYLLSYIIGIFCKYIPVLISMYINVF